MTDAHDPSLDDLDRAARAASHGLHAHVNRQVEPELLLASLPPHGAAPNRGRLLAAAAVAVLFIGTVAVLGDGPGGDDRSRLELDEDGNKLPPPQPGVLTPLGPRDGRDSIQLPVEVEPNVDLRDGDKVTVTGPGFVPGERVGIVQCASEAGEGNGGTREQRAGIDVCNLGTVQYGTRTPMVWLSAPSTCSACSRPRPPARSTARSRRSAASSRWAPSATTTAPAASGWRSSVVASRSTSRPSPCRPPRACPTARSSTSRARGSSRARCC